MTGEHQVALPLGGQVASAWGQGPCRTPRRRRTGVGGDHVLHYTSLTSRPSSSTSTRRSPSFDRPAGPRRTASRRGASLQTQSVTGIERWPPPPPLPAAARGARARPTGDAPRQETAPESRWLAPSPIGEVARRGQREQQCRMAHQGPPAPSRTAHAVPPRRGAAVGHTTAHSAARCHGRRTVGREPE